MEGDYEVVHIMESPGTVPVNGHHCMLPESKASVWADVETNGVLVWIVGWWNGISCM